MANNVGTAYVTIMPSMTGFSSEVSKGFSSASSSASKAFGASNMGSEASKTFSKGFSAKMGGIIGAVSSVTSSAIGAISNSLSGAISRVDTLNNYPKVMESLGYSSKEASKSIDTISKALDGLPSSTNGVASMVQSLAPLSSSLGEATDLGLALNNMMLASGASTSDVSRAMQQYTQILSKGKPDLQDWRTLQEVMPGQLNQVAEAMLGEGKSSTDLYNSLKSGKTSMSDFNKAVLELNENGGKGFKSFQEQAKNATQGIQTALDNVQNRINKAVADVVQAIGAENISGAINAFSSSFSVIGKGVAGVITEVKGYLGGVWDALEDNGTISTVTGMFDELTQAVGDVFSNMPDWSAIVPPEAVASGIKAVVDNVSQAFEALKGVMGGGQLEALGENLGSKLLPVLQPMLPIVQQLAGQFQELVGSVADALMPILPTLGDLVSKVATIVGGVLSAAFQVIVPIIANVSSTIMQVAQVALPIVISAIGGVISIVDQVLGAITEAMDFVGTIASTVSGVASDVLGTVSGAIEDIVGYFGGIAGSIGSALSPVTSTVSSVFDGIGKVISAPLTNAKGLVKLACNGIKGAFSVFSSIKGTVSGIFNGVKNAISKPLETAKNLVKGAISKISGIINGAKLSLPHFKLPHFNINGGKLPWGIGGKGKAPSISVDWYAKGGVFDSAQVIGIGEAGREAALPLNNRTYSEIAKGITDQGASSNSVVINLNYTADADANQMVRDIASGLRRLQMTGA